jgi:hypothetical protein
MRYDLVGGYLNFLLIIVKKELKDDFGKLKKDLADSIVKTNNYFLYPLHKGSFL